MDRPQVFAGCGRSGDRKMKCSLYLDGEAAALWRKLPKGARSIIVSGLLLDAYRQDKLNLFLPVSGSSSRPARVRGYEVGDQETDGYDEGSGSEKPHGPQQDQQGSGPVKERGGESDDRKSPLYPKWLIEIEKNIEDLAREREK